jgi:hypothetical protein
VTPLKLISVIAKSSEKVEVFTSTQTVRNILVSGIEAKCTDLANYTTQINNCGMRDSLETECLMATDSSMPKSGSERDRTKLITNM